MRLKPIGQDSRAAEWGFDFEKLVGWLEDIQNHENELAEVKPGYRKRAEKLEELVGALGDLI